MRKNPIVEFREKAGMTRAELARILGINYHTLYLTEKGYPASVPKRVAEALARYGINTQKLQEDYVLWRAWLGEEAEEKIARAMEK